MMPPDSLTALTPTAPSDPAPGQDHGATVAMLFSQRAEEQVDRRPSPARLVKFRDGDLVVGDVQPAVGRDDIDVIRLQRHRILDLQHGHIGARGQNAGHLAAHIRIEMHDDDEGRAGFFGQRSEQMLQRADAAGRGADADHDGFGLARLRFLDPLLVARFGHRAAHSLSVADGIWPINQEFGQGNSEPN